MDWKESLEDFWENVKDHVYYILFVAILLFLPFILGAPAADLPPPFSILNVIYSGREFPVITDIYGIAQSANLFGSSVSVMDVITLCMIWAIFAASWDLLSGYTGQVSFGHALFWGVAAYVSFWFVIGVPVGPDFQDLLGEKVVLEPFLALLLGAAVAALLALCIGIVALRVKGPYLALVTLILPLIFMRLTFVFLWFDIGLEGELFGFDYSLILFDNIDSGGEHGLRNLQSPLIPSVDNGGPIDTVNFYLVVMLVFFASVVLMMAIGFSRLGLAFQSIREDEDAAESLGINVSFYKILAFTASAFFAGVAGGLYAQSIPFAEPGFFGTSYSFSVIIFAVIGGVGSITGGVIGAFLLLTLTDLFLEDIFEGVDADVLSILAFGFLLILALRYMRFGLVRATKEQKKACVLGLLFALSWAILDSIFSIDVLKPLDSVNDTIQNLQNLKGIDSITAFGSIIVIYPALIGLLLMFLLCIPAIPVFWISEIIGLFLLEEVLGMSLKPEVLIKAKFLIYASVGIPYIYYLPKIFKKIRLRFWGVWPSVGRYEPD
ncbi:MAG: branched-chain amino acid ABC transporter permease [Candidatus Hodarchaeota archaeon]